MAQVRFCLRLAVLLAAIACAAQSAMVPQAAAEDHPAAKNYRFGLAVGHSGLGDQGFNDLQVMGMGIAHQKYGIQYKVVVPKDASQDKTKLDELIASGCNVIFAGAWDYRDALHELAQANPDIKFILLDSPPTTYLENVASVTFRQNEASFLAGALAARMTETEKLCAIGGEDHPVIRDFLVGFAAGANYVNADITLEYRFIKSSYPGHNPWIAAEPAEALANELYIAGCDVLFALAGQSNKGVFRSAAAFRRYAIGSDSDQDFLAPGYILASVMKRLDTAIVYMVERILDGRFENRNYSLGLFEHGVALSPMTYTRQLIGRKAYSQIEKLKFRIVDGTIDVPSALPH